MDGIILVFDEIVTFIATLIVISDVAHVAANEIEANGNVWCASVRKLIFFREHFL